MRVRTLSLLSAAVAGVVLMPASAVGAATTKTPEIDAAVQVTKDTGAARGHSIPAMAVDPRDPNTLVVAEGDAYASRCYVHVSRNGGLTWSDATQPTVPPEWAGCGFAVTGPLAHLAFSADGTLFYVWSAFQGTTYQQRIYLARSSDLGLTWDVTALPRIGPDPAQRQFGADTMPSIVVDRDDPKRIYVSWWSNNGTWNLPSTLSGSDSSVWCRLVDNRIIARPWVATSTDGGATFGSPVDIAPGIDQCLTEPYLAQAKDGTLLAYFGQATRTLDAGKAPPANLFLSTSSDHGKTFKVAPIHEQSGPADGRSATSTSDWLGAPSPGVNLTTGELYVTWEEMGTGVPSIQFMRSGDNGKTWSQPLKVNDGDAKRDWDFPEQFPTMGVAPNGRIDIAWYDWRNDAGYKDGDTRNQFQDIYFATSSDGGKSFAKNVRLNDRQIDRRFGPRRQGSIDGPLGVAATDNVTYVAWDDTRNGNENTAAQDIYFTRARYAAPAQAFGGGGADKGTSPVLAGFLGAAIAIAIGGLGLVIGTSAAKRRAGEPSKPAPTPTAPGQAPAQVG